MDATGSGTVAKVGIAGTVNGNGVLVLGDVVTVERDGAEVTRSHVQGLGRFVVAAGGDLRPAGGGRGRRDLGRPARRRHPGAVAATGRGARREMAHLGDAARPAGG